MSFVRRGGLLGLVPSFPAFTMPKRSQKAVIGDGDQEAARPSKSAAKPSSSSAAAAASPMREGPRSILPDYNSLDKLVESLRTCRNIVVVTGAGISVSCGIPDFRSENGVYEMASQLDLGLSCAEDLFDLEFFTDDPAPFFKFAKALYPGSYVPSLTHRFLKALENRKKLLRNFTQNIDGLEAQVGLKKYVACHGSFLTASCLSCKAKRKAEDIRAEVMRQEVPQCPVCRRGVMKPDITFFGEKLPNAVKRAVEADHKKADLFLVLGTSLQVAPVSRILQFIPPTIPQVLVNRELVRPPKTISNGFDLHLLGDCDIIIQYLCERLGWELPEAVQAPALLPQTPSSPVGLSPPTTTITTAATNESYSKIESKCNLPPSNEDRLKKGSRQDVREIDDGVLGSGGRGAVTGEDAVESGTVIDHPPPSAPVFVPPNTFTFRSPDPFG